VRSLLPTQRRVGARRAAPEPAAGTFAPPPVQEPPPALAKLEAEADAQVRELLATARQALGMSVTFLSRMDGTTQHLEKVDTSIGVLFKEGYRQEQDLTLCQAIREGALPAVIPDLREHPEAMALPAARFPRLRSYVSVPVVFSDGTTYGSFCGAGLTTDRGLAERDRALMDVLARAAAVVLEPAVRDRARVAALLERLAPVVAAGGPVVLLQPIVDLATGRRVGAEALSRFPAEWSAPPDACFADAHDVGLGAAMELMALERAAAHLPEVSGYVSMNVSPAVLVSTACRDLLQRMPLDRVLLELSEHDPVEDYVALREALAPLRAAGLRVAVDDVGAGFSSLRHIVEMRPDVLKVDRSLVDGVAGDPVLRELVVSLVTLARSLGADVVAEGVETVEDADALRGAGVPAIQGWLAARAAGPDELLDVYPAVLPAPTHTD
jgi:EAL domain-containing protein (putative c-di-GMP-specific phosphodiesterase class I)